MNNNSQDLEKIDLVSEFIDYLNIEKKPKIGDENFEDLEMLQMFETVRAVKRLRVDEELMENKAKLKGTALGQIISIKKFAVAAAIFIVALTSLKALNLSSPLMDKKSDEQMNTMMAPENGIEKKQNTESVAASDLLLSSKDKKPNEQINAMLIPKNSTGKRQNSENTADISPLPPKIDTKSEEQMNAMLAPESKMMNKQSLEDHAALATDNDTVYAMEKAYENIIDYSGVIEVRSEDENGRIDFLETIEIKYKKPNKYIFVQRSADQTITIISDGEKLYTIDSNFVTIDYLNPEKEILGFSIGRKIQELKKAAEVKQIGEEVLLGREALVYEFSFSNNEPVNKIWIDKNTNLPLKQELNMPDGRKLMNQYVQIEVNPSFDDSIFSYKIKDGERVKYENKESSLEDVE